MSPSQASASPSAIAKPIPRFEPVTTATFKTNRLHNDFLIFTEYFVVLQFKYVYFYVDYLFEQSVCINAIFTWHFDT